MPIESILQSPSGCTPRRGLPAAPPRGALPRTTHHSLGLSSGQVPRWGGLATPGGARPLAAVPDPRASTQVTTVETPIVSASVGFERPTHGTYSSETDSGMETDSGSATANASVRLLLVVGVVLLDDPEWRHANAAPGDGNGNGYSSRTWSTSPGQQQQPVRVLLAQRPADKSYAGLWEFPGGKVDPGETPEAAAVRELREELGILVDPCELQPLSFASHTYPTFHLLMPLYVCRRWKGEPRGAEGQAVVWVTGDQIYSYNLTPADIPLVPAVLAAMRHTPPPPAQSPLRV